MFVVYHPAFRPRPASSSGGALRQPFPL